MRITWPTAKVHSKLLEQLVLVLAKVVSSKHRLVALGRSDSRISQQLLPLEVRLFFDHCAVCFFKVMATYVRCGGKYDNGFIAYS